MKKIGRNEFCPCGSEKKYKHCCGVAATKNTTNRIVFDKGTKELLSKGQLSLAAGNYDEAATLFRDALKTCPGSGPIHALLGSALHSAGLYDEAMEALSNAVRISPGIAEAHNDLGLVYEAKNQFKQAIACFREALKAKPDLFPARMNLARALQHHGDHHDRPGPFQHPVDVRHKRGRRRAVGGFERINQARHQVHRKLPFRLNVDPFARSAIPRGGVIPAQVPARQRKARGDPFRL